MGAYDILTGTQLCMAVAMIAYGFYFKKKRTCRVWYFSGLADCHLVGCCIILLFRISFFNDPLLPHGIFLRHGNRIVG